MSKSVQHRQNKYSDTCSGFFIEGEKKKDSLILRVVTLSMIFVLFTIKQLSSKLLS